ncbi:unnamed protein product [Lepeophtheirus salmonis]|uniref:(salmon louse) hypothetical protein n=1 Tax=Lepeophtheirus salmonis TaxID=72036 RepID=A0A7R8CEN9_LEPSM|nr:unnamed protein product [Lepeophtheirus salmonis]CAF2754245.1 unnamed protein product [Lepeophtheirus salmonis]
MIPSSIAFLFIAALSSSPKSPPPSQKKGDCLPTLCGLYKETNHKMKLIVFCFLFIAITYAQKLETNKTSALCDKYSCKYNYLCYKSGSIIKTLFHCCTYLKCKKGIIRATIVGKSKKCGCCRDPFNGPYGMIKNGGYGVRKNRWSLLYGGPLATYLLKNKVLEFDF